MRSRNNLSLRRNRKNLKKETLNMALKSSTNFRPSSCSLPITLQKSIPQPNSSTTRSISTTTRLRRRRRPTNKNLLKNGRKNKRLVNHESKETKETTERGKTEKRESMSLSERRKSTREARRLT
jgi:hypothetical protein